jgi:hypothetical protein
LEGKIWLNQIWFGNYLGEDDAKARSIPDAKIETIKLKATLYSMLSFQG